MIWRRSALAAAIIFGLVTAQAEERDPHDAEYLIYWGPARPVFLRLTLNVDGQTHLGAWTAAAERLFDAFIRLKGSEKVEGNGVGLSIVQRIVQRHGGRVWATAAPGQGATFRFSLPQEPAGL